MNAEHPSDSSQIPGTTTEVRKTTTETYEKRTTTTEYSKSHSVTGGAKKPRSQEAKKFIRPARRSVIGTIGCRIGSVSRSQAWSRRVASARPNWTGILSSTW